MVYPLRLADHRTLLQPFSKGGVANPRCPCPGEPINHQPQILNSAPGGPEQSTRQGEPTSFFFPSCPFQNPSIPQPLRKSTGPHQGHRATGGLLTAWRECGNSWELAAMRGEDRGWLDWRGSTSPLTIPLGPPSSTRLVSPALACSGSRGPHQVSSSSSISQSQKSIRSSQSRLCPSA